MKKRLFKLCNYLFLMNLFLGCVPFVQGAGKKKILLIDTEAVSSMSSEKIVMGTKSTNTKKLKGIAQIKSVIRKYKTSSGVSMILKKKVYLALMESEKNSTGKVTLSKGRLRLEIKSPDQSLLIMSKKTLWIENRFNNDLQISKVSMVGRGRRKGLIGMFFDDESMWNGYHLVRAKTNEGITTYRLKPKASNKKREAELVEIEINREKVFIVALRYWDDLENRTEFQFSDVQFDVEVSKTDFEYNPPNGVEINEY